MTIGEGEYLAPRTCFLPPVPELDAAADLLSEAADALLMSRIERARELMRCADLPTLRDYALRIMGREDPWVHRRRGIGDLQPAQNKAGQRMPSAPMKGVLYARDGWRCRFCGCRVVTMSARDRMRRLLPGAIRVGVPAREYHAAFLALTAVPDHVVPHSAGGSNDLDNLVTACWPCNNGRGAYRLEELGLIDPRTRPPVVDAWDGLSRLLLQGMAPRTGGAITQISQESGMLAKVRPAAKHGEQGDAAAVGWIAAIDRIEPAAGRRLMAFADGCKDLGVSYSINEVMIIRMRVEQIVIQQFGIEANGDVCIPWFIAGHKAVFRPFAEAVARAIPGAAAVESPKQWIVKREGRRVRVSEFMPSLDAIREALIDLHTSLRDVALKVSIASGD